MIKKRKGCDFSEIKLITYLVTLIDKVADRESHLTLDKVSFLVQSK